MKPSRSALLFSAAALVSVVLLGAAETQAPPSTATKAVSAATAPKTDLAPAVTVVKAAQIKDALNKAKGKAVVLNFWGTYCPPCVAEMPEFVSFYKSVQGKDVVLLSVDCDDPADVNKTVKPFIDAKKIPFPVSILDDAPDEVSKVIGAAWDGGLPATFVYDTAGKLKKTIEGQTTAKELATLVEPLLPKKSPAK